MVQSCTPAVLTRYPFLSSCSDGKLHGHRSSSSSSQLSTFGFDFYALFLFSSDFHFATSTLEGLAGVTAAAAAVGVFLCASFCLCFFRNFVCDHLLVWREGHRVQCIMACLTTLGRSFSSQLEHSMGPLRRPDNASSRVFFSECRRP